MAIVFLDGFDLYSDATATDIGLKSRWVYDGGTTTNLAMVAGRIDGQSLRQGNNTGNTCSHYAILDSNYATFGVGFAFKYDNLSGAGLTGGAAQYNVALMDGAVVHLSLHIHANGTMYIKRGASTTLLTSAAGLFTTDAWHYFEIYGTISDTVGTCDVYFNGALIMTGTGLDTRNAGNAYINRIRLNCPDGSGSAGIAYHDDLYVSDSLTRVGERRIKTLRPAADTADKGFTASTGSDNFAMVDDAVADGDASYVQGSTAGDLDLYDLEDLGVTVTAIDAVQLTTFAKKTDVSARSLITPIKHGGTLSDGTAVALGTSYDDIRRLMPTNPVTAAAWTQSDVDNLQVGLKVA